MTINKQSKNLLSANEFLNKQTWKKCSAPTKWYIKNISINWSIAENVIRLCVDIDTVFTLRATADQCN